MSNVVTIDITAQSGEKVRKSFDRALATVSKFDKAMEKTERQMEKMARDTFQVCAQPVSYTHLDVYKRQG